MPILRARHSAWTTMIVATFAATLPAGLLAAPAPATKASPTAPTAMAAPTTGTTAGGPTLGAKPVPARSAAAPAGSAVFPTKVSTKYASQKAGDARMHTCLDQYHANKAANANGGLEWIQKGGGYYSQCSKKLKG